MSQVSAQTSFDERIAPIVFAEDQPAEAAPTITILTGQPGAGTTAAVHAIHGGAHGIHPVISADSLAVFHPDYLELRRWQPLEAQSAMAPLIAQWLSDSLDYARAHRRSLILEGSFSNTDAVWGTVASFADEGFTSRLVVAAARRSDSLLVATSRYLELRRRGLPALFTDQETHRRGQSGAQALVHEAEATEPVDQLTVLYRGQRRLFDAHRAEGFIGAAEALAASERTPLSTLQAAEWFSELRHVTEYARSARELAPAVVDVLVELHELALEEVITRLQVRRESSFMLEQEARLRRELLDLRRGATAEIPRPDVPAPVFVPPAPRPGGPSL